MMRLRTFRQRFGILEGAHVLKIAFYKVETSFKDSFGNRFRIVQQNVVCVPGLEPFPTEGTHCSQSGTGTGLRTLSHL